jgi:hypothetical protein
MCLSIFSTTLSETSHILRIIYRDTITDIHFLQCQVPVNLMRF